MKPEVDRERLQWPDLDALDRARDDGDYHPLADYLRTEHLLHPDTREWLARLLLGDLPPRRSGRPRGAEAQLRDWKLFVHVTQRMEAEGLSQEKVLTEYAQELDSQTNNAGHDSLDSVRARFKRAKRKWGMQS